MALAGRESVEEYRWDRVAARVLEFYASAAKVRAARAGSSAA